MRNILEFSGRYLSFSRGACNNLSGVGFVRRHRQANRIDAKPRKFEGEYFNLQLSGMRLNVEVNNPAASAHAKIIAENGDCRHVLPPPELSGLSCENRGGTTTYCQQAPAVATPFFHMFANVRISIVGFVLFFVFCFVCQSGGD